MCGLVLPDVNERLLRPITANELLIILGQGAKRKYPQMDGLSLEFYAMMWEYTKEDMLCVYNEILLHGGIQSEEKMGILVCIPKIAQPTPQDFRPITLLNTDCKILVRLIAKRLRTSLPNIIHPGQHCRVPDRNIFDAVAGLRDDIACAELTAKPRFQASAAMLMRSAAVWVITRRRMVILFAFFPWTLHCLTVYHLYICSVCYGHMVTMTRSSC
jgi:hypothetical protein